MGLWTKASAPPHAPAGEMRLGSGGFPCPPAGALGGQAEHVGAWRCPCLWDPHQLARVPGHRPPRQQPRLHCRFRTSPWEPQRPNQREGGDTPEPSLGGYKQVPWLFPKSLLPWLSQALGWETMDLTTQGLFLTAASNSRPWCCGALPDSSVGCCQHLLCSSRAACLGN